MYSVNVHSKFTTWHIDQKFELSTEQVKVTAMQRHTVASVFSSQRAFTTFRKLQQPTKQDSNVVNKGGGRGEVVNQERTLWLLLSRGQATLKS